MQFEVRLESCCCNLSNFIAINLYSLHAITKLEDVPWPQNWVMFCEFMVMTKSLIKSKPIISFYCSMKTHSDRFQITISDIESYWLHNLKFIPFTNLLMNATLMEETVSVLQDVTSLSLAMVPVPSVSERRLSGWHGWLSLLRRLSIFWNRRRSLSAFMQQRWLWIRFGRLWVLPRM